MTRRSRKTIELSAMALSLTLIIIAGCNASHVGGGTAKKDSSTPETEAVEKAAERMLGVYRNAKTYADHATYVEQSVYRGEGVEHELPYYQMTLALERPNKLRLTCEEAIASSKGRQAYEVVSDGVKLRASATGPSKATFETDAPEKLTLENLLANEDIKKVFQDRPLGEVFPQLAMLLVENPNEAIFPEDTHERMLPDAKLRGRVCRRIASTHPEGTRVLWIDRDTQVLMRMELPAEGQRRRTQMADEFLKFAVWIDFEDPLIDSEIDGKSFELAAPAKEAAGAPQGSPEEADGEKSSDSVTENSKEAAPAATNLNPQDDADKE